MQYQTTIQNPVSCYGIGAHSGKRTQLTLKPAKENTGIVFVRTDITEVSPHILANYANVSETTLCTTISNDAKVKVATIEHLMAAIWGAGIDNLIVEVDGEEVPIMDGSSRPFVFMIECAGEKVSSTPKRQLKILKEVSFTNKDSEVIITPSETFGINMIIDFESKAIGRQEREFMASDSFKDTLAPARTFGFLHELEYLKSKGLARGASLDNAIGIDKDTIMNADGLRFDDEFVRHKLLDSVGDLFSAGGFIIGKLHCHKPGHYMNNQLLRKIFEDSSSYEWS